MSDGALDINQYSTRKSINLKGKKTKIPYSNTTQENPVKESFQIDLGLFFIILQLYLMGKNLLFSRLKQSNM